VPRNRPDPELSRWGRLGGLTTAARYDPVALTAEARRVFREEHFARQVDPQGTLPPEERVRRAEAARRLWYARLAEASVKARRRRATARPRPADVAA
jgi:hypothetical protein